MLHDVFTKVLSEIENSDAICLVSVCAESCERQEPMLLSGLKKFIEEEDPSIKLFHVCFSEEEMSFPRLATQVVYYFLPKSSTPSFHRIGLVNPNTMRQDIMVLNRMASGEKYEKIIYPNNPGIIEKVDGMIEKEASLKFPSIFQQSRNFAVEGWNASKKLLSGGQVLVSADVAYERYSICQKCPFFQNTRCTKCGCFMEAKVHLTTSECPINNWGKVEI
jgi:hypothetical protein